MSGEAVAVISKIGVDELEAPPLTLRELTWRRFRRHKMAMFGMVMLILLFVYSFGGALLVPEKYANQVDTAGRLQAPSVAHPFGTDTIGRDILARTIYGGQISLMIGLTAMLVELMIGVTIGALAGYYGGKIDALLMRFTEAVFVIPQLFLLIVMAKYFGGKIPNIHLLGRELSGSVIVVVLIIGITSWMYLARIVRAEFISIKEREFILAARATGTPARQIIFGHILPNSVAPIIVSATLSVAAAILAESYISFLGMGVQPPTATWGNMLEAAASDYTGFQIAPWFWFFPGMFIVLTVLSINFLGDGLRDAFDPRSRAV
ncbi:MAG: ABC transporter permease [Anaerolineae bacterium]|nr:ABC transporter permease [Anaerolineae bacterium]